jgi:type 1 fimbria pilin
MELLMYKKKGLGALAALMALGMSAHAAADTPSSELKVTGSLGAPGCMVNIVGGNELDFGSISPDRVPDGDIFKSLGFWLPKNIDVNCDAKTYMSFSVIDNQVDSLPAQRGEPGYFGLGKVNGTGSLGYFEMLMDGMTVDGETAYMYDSSTNYSTDYLNLARDRFFRWSIPSHDPSPAPMGGQHFEAVVRIEPYIANKTVMNGPITGDVHMNGSVTFNFSYGL